VRLRQARDEGLLDVFAQMEFERTLCEFANVQGGCERIKNTPFPREYDFYTDFFVQIFCLLLPFGLVDSAGWWSIPLTLIISYIFTVIDVVGEKYEDPFENRPQDTPLSAICRLIEVDLQEQLGEQDLPELLQPVDGCLM
jgi:putative membrane protein